jgi:hypothetical protein
MGERTGSVEICTLGILSPANLTEVVGEPGPAGGGKGGLR